MCRVTCQLRAALYPQLATGHPNGLSPVCFLMCAFKCVDCDDAYVQPSQVHCAKPIDITIVNINTPEGVTRCSWTASYLERLFASVRAHMSLQVARPLRRVCATGHRALVRSVRVLGVLGASTATRTNAWGSNCGTRIRHVCAQIEFCQVVSHVDILFVRATARRLGI